MTEEVKKEPQKTKLPGLPPLVAFIYAVLIFIMTMGYLKVFLIMGLRMNPDEAGMLSFFAGTFFAYIGNRGVRAMFKLRELSK